MTNFMKLIKNMYLTPGKYLNVSIKCEKKIKDIFNEISKPADLPKMNGMSEIFVWTKQLDTIARKLMDKNQYKG